MCRLVQCFILPQEPLWWWWRLFLLSPLLYRIIPVNLTSHSRRRGTGQELRSKCKALGKWRRLIAFYDFPHFSIWDGKVRNRIIFLSRYVDYEVIVSTHSSLVEEEKKEDLTWQQRRSRTFRKHSHHHFSSITYTIMSSDNDSAADGLFDDVVNSLSRCLTHYFNWINFIYFTIYFEALKSYTFFIQRNVY